MSTTPRQTVRIPDALREDVDALVEAGVFADRSEAMREGLRRIVREYHDTADLAGGQLEVTER